MNLLNTNSRRSSVDSFSPVSTTDTNTDSNAAAIAAANEREILELINREYIVRWLLGTSESVGWALFFDWVWPFFSTGCGLVYLSTMYVWPCLALFFH